MGTEALGIDTLARGGGIKRSGSDANHYSFCRLSVGFHIEAEALMKINLDRCQKMAIIATNQAIADAGLADFSPQMIRFNKSNQNRIKIKSSHLERSGLNTVPNG